MRRRRPRRDPRTLGSAALAFIPLDDAESHPKYGERFAVWLGGALLIDAFTFLVVSKPSK